MRFVERQSDLIHRLWLKLVGQKEGKDSLLNDREKEFVGALQSRFYVRRKVFAGFGGTHQTGLKIQRMMLEDLPDCLRA